MQIILLPASAASSSSSTSATLRKFQNAIAPKSCASSSSSEHDCDSLADESYEQQSTVSRKRQRLNDLTEQEKLFRRKLKNRVAAQTARDKKKAKMEELEIIVEQLRIENERLKAENHLLLAEKMRLSNKEEVAPNVVLKEENVREMEAEMYPVESAAGTGLHSSYCFQNASSVNVAAAITCSAKQTSSNRSGRRIGTDESDISGVSAGAQAHSRAGKVSRKRTATDNERRNIKATTLETEGSIDILNWLAKAVLENDEEIVSKITTKTEPADFDLLSYVDCPGDETDETLNERIIDQLVLFSAKGSDSHSNTIVPSTLSYDENCSATALPIVPVVNIDLLECDSKSQEIIDYDDFEPQSNRSISTSSIFDDTMEEPNWLSTWDSL